MLVVQARAAFSSAGLPLLPSLYLLPFLVRTRTRRW